MNTKPRHSFSMFAAMAVALGIGAPPPRRREEEGATPIGLELNLPRVGYVVGYDPAAGRDMSTVLARTTGRYEVVRDHPPISGAELRAHEKRERKAAKKRRDRERAAHGKPQRIPEGVTVISGELVPDIENCLPPCACLGFFGVGRCTITLINDNDDRTRAEVRCESCKREWFACRAKRLATEPDETGNREAWGPSVCGVSVRRCEHESEGIGNIAWALDGRRLQADSDHRRNPRA